jgi:CxxC motif-containing protein (DUF1111 family)
VIQLGQTTTRTRVVRGNADYGYILNTAAIRGFQPEARVSIEYTARPVTLANGAIVALREPRYHVDTLDGPRLAPTTLLMPRMPPPVQGAGLLELVPAVELERVARSERKGPDGVRGHLAWLDTNTGRAVGATGKVISGGGGVAKGAVDSDGRGVGAGEVESGGRSGGAGGDISDAATGDGVSHARVGRIIGGGASAIVASAHHAGQVIGRFGWQASEPSVASQVAIAFAREMGLTNPLEPHDDCGPWNVACLTAPSGGTPEVEPVAIAAVDEASLLSMFRQKLPQDRDRLVRKLIDKEVTAR